MKADRAYCDHCGRYEVMFEAETSRVIPVRGVDIEVTYTGKFCSACGKELYDEDVEINVYNSAKAIYRKKKNLLSPTEVARILKGYDPDYVAEAIGVSAGLLIGASHGGLLSPDQDTALRAFDAAPVPAVAAA